MERQYWEETGVEEWGRREAIFNHRAFARAVLSRYGHRAALKRLHELENKADLSPAPPAPKPADGEVAELVAWLRNMANAGLGGLDELNAARAADLLSQRHPAPVPVAEPVVEGPTDEEVEVWADQQGFVRGHADHPCGFWIDDGDVGALVRAALSRWGHQPAPGAEGEVGELVAWLRDRAESTSLAHNALRITRAADLLERQAVPVPQGEGEK